MSKLGKNCVQNHTDERFGKFSTEFTVFSNTFTVYRVVEKTLKLRQLIFSGTPNGNCNRTKASQTSRPSRSCQTSHCVFLIRSVRTACAHRVLTLRKLLGATENASFDGVEQPAHRQHSTRTYCAYGTGFSDRKI